MTRDCRPPLSGRANGAARRFTRTIEDFDCVQCGRHVRGNGYTNHCPYCLHSRHVDVSPGDRAADCGGLMTPTAAGTEHGQNFVIHRCQTCGHLHKNKVAPQDDQELLLRYFGQPIPVIKPR